MLFVSDSLILDTLYLVSANKGDGKAEYDGHYGIHMLLDIGGPKRSYVDFPDQASRDTTFEALLDWLRVEQGEDVDGTLEDAR